MSQREILVLGDSNVQRFYSKLGLAAQLLDFHRVRNKEELTEALKAVKSCYKFIIMAFLTNLIVSAGDESANNADRLCAVELLFNEILPLIR